MKTTKQIESELNKTYEKLTAYGKLSIQPWIELAVFVIAWSFTK